LNQRKGDFPNSERATEVTLALPVYPELTAIQQMAVVQVIKEFLS